ncbi:MAG TPA: HAD-IB family hydrolase [Acidimicrobiales bacterium]|nr:HAD-IB family hydrolase [Acidimicrobiales bacterium]
MTRSATVAAFDLDGTLTEGGSVFKWLAHVAGRRATYGAAARLAVPLAIGGLRSGPTADRVKERLFRALLTGRDAAEVVDESRIFAHEHLESKVRPLTHERLRWHLAQGHDVVLVSASPEIYVRVVADEVRAHGALGTRLAVDPLGHLTGGYLGLNCRGEEKMRRLREWIEERHGTDDVSIYAYGNSRGDRRMLRGATHPYNVGRLGPLGALRRYPRLRRASPTDE